MLVRYRVTVQAFIADNKYHQYLIMYISYTYYYKCVVGVIAVEALITQPRCSRCNTGCKRQGFGPSMFICSSLKEVHGG